MTSPTPSVIGCRLQNASSFAFSTYCIVAAFGTYFCMYAFRKPFTAATYADAVWLGIGFKTVLVAAQVAGYTLSKFIGIKVVSEMPARHRAMSILGLIGFSEVALFLFAVTPMPWNLVWLFANGLPLGMVFGLVLGFLEGRRVTEALAAGLCASFIVSSGVVKSVGRSLIQDFGVGDYWMPFLTGLIFVIPLTGFVWLLAQIPPPSQADELKRTKRGPMQGADRRSFFRRHAIGLIGLLVIYALLTIVRSIRDDFAVEIWQELGVSTNSTVFARSELCVMFAVICFNGMAFVINENRTAFLISLVLLVTGFVIAIGAVIGQQAGILSPMAFMVALGMGFYVPYVALHTSVFERMIATFREVGTVGYLVYLADAVGYSVYILVMVFRQSLSADVSFLTLLNGTAIGVSIVSMLIAVLLLVHYRRQTRTTEVAGVAVA